MTVDQLEKLHKEYVPKQKDDYNPKKYIQDGSIADIGYTLLSKGGNSRKEQIGELAKELKLDFLIRQIVPKYKVDIDDIMEEYNKKMEIVNKM